MSVDHTWFGKRIVPPSAGKGISSIPCSARRERAAGVNPHELRHPVSEWRVPRPASSASSHRMQGSPHGSCRSRRRATRPYRIRHPRHRSLHRRHVPVGAHPAHAEKLTVALLDRLQSFIVPPSRDLLLLLACALLLGPGEYAVGAGEQLVFPCSSKRRAHTVLRRHP